MDNIRTPYIRTPHIGTPSIRTFSVGGSGVGKKLQPTPVVETPVITITDTTATITCATVGATIYYTLDGSTPTSSSTEYTEAITLTQSCTIKAIAVKSGMTDSEVASESYVHIQYLTAWELVGNSEVHGSEIWSCGEYSTIDGKWHILVQPLGGSIADIAIDEPLRKINDVTDTIEFPSSTEGKALVTRNIASKDMGDMAYSINNTNLETRKRLVTGSIKDYIAIPADNATPCVILCPRYAAAPFSNIMSATADPTLAILGISNTGVISIYDPDYNPPESATAYKTAMSGVELIYELATPTTELVDAPQIEEADSYTCVISQGGKAVEWSSFTVNPE